MATALHNLSKYNKESIPDASNMCFGIVVAEWNSDITNALLYGAVNTLEKQRCHPVYPAWRKDTLPRVRHSEDSDG